MSHIVEAKTAIKNPDRALLAQAAQIVATTHGGMVSEHYHDYYGRQKETQLKLAVFTSAVHRGIGLDLARDSSLIFKGDPYGVQVAYDKLQQEIIQSYVALATIEALRSMGYQPHVEQQENGQVAIRGVNYA